MNGDWLSKTVSPSGHLLEGVVEVDAIRKVKGGAKSFSSARHGNPSALVERGGLIDRDEFSLKKARRLRINP